jgi:hypothetical protein
MRTFKKMYLLQMLSVQLTPLKKKRRKIVIIGACGERLGGQKRLLF